jgi:hypothetical protein
MNRIIRQASLCAMAVALQAFVAALALAQTAPAGQAGAATGHAGAPAGYGNQSQEASRSESQGTPGIDLPVLYVTNVEVLRTVTEPKLDIVRVSGLASSQGWTAPQLVPTFVGKPLDDILDLQFIATMPDQSQPATGFVPVGAVFTLDENHPFKGVRVRASENAIEVKQIPGNAQAAISADSCKDCIGKKFVEKGQGQPGQSGVVRQEDLPKVLRWIIPNRGIRGITHNPNRLNLILDGNNTIVQAYWE